MLSTEASFTIFSVCIHSFVRSKRHESRAFQSILLLSFAWISLKQVDRHDLRLLPRYGAVVPLRVSNGISSNKQADDSYVATRAEKR